MVKKRTWLVIGHKKGTKEKDRKIGSVRYVGQATKSIALKRAKRDYSGHIVTRVE